MHDAILVMIILTTQFILTTFMINLAWLDLRKRMIEHSKFSCSCAVKEKSHG